MNLYDLLRFLVSENLTYMEPGFRSPADDSHSNDTLKHTKEGKEQKLVIIMQPGRRAAFGGITKQLLYLQAITQCCDGPTLN